MRALYKPLLPTFPHPPPQVSISRTGFPSDTLQALRYLLSPDDPASGPSGFTEPGSGELEGQVAKVLVYACEQELAAAGERMVMHTHTHTHTHTFSLTSHTHTHTHSLSL